ncbi:hypothetical protein CONLIGDRAFT_648934 [Coniochaeta ligniaria NRRL 30616]|uniref:Uncharacterized protein n=1 Tax=Coniochaeta ligniaria NRRL 30616 TaxID=1408157 RepID=A0A1J7I9J3_9PEZI|nr:hypothetical protein CONLIGDRAFT_648934 [Coniochaeta ligniaria NRRL 30616]
MSCGYRLRIDSELVGSVALQMFQFPSHATSVVGPDAHILANVLYDSLGPIRANKLLPISWRRPQERYAICSRTSRPASATLSIMLLYLSSYVSTVSYKSQRSHARLPIQPTLQPLSSFSAKFCSQYELSRSLTRPRPASTSMHRISTTTMPIQHVVARGLDNASDELDFTRRDVPLDAFDTLYRFNSPVVEKPLGEFRVRLRGLTAVVNPRGYSLYLESDTQSALRLQIRVCLILGLSIKKLQGGNHYSLEEPFIRFSRLTAWILRA